MPLFAIMSDDGQSVREIRNFVDVPTFKPGKVFPVVYAPQPVFDPTLSSIVEVWNLPVNGTVTVSWNVVDLSQGTKDSNAKVKKLRDLYNLADPLEAKRAAGNATASELRSLGEIAWQITDLMRKQFIETLKS